ncbi:MAG: hypothetical protein UY34_C0044G0003 [Parcubacteria group bacterium GW2011_GWA2_48_9]|nr:MAG: hypothetical protein UY34_C0044G0003 [Parcubacteria group bacterium GW2011_GWA2_48_9]
MKTNYKFKKLSQADRADIIKHFRKEKNILQLSKIYNVSRATIRYHLKKTKLIKFVCPNTYADYLSKEQAREKKTLQCQHPSLKCGVCGKFIDNLK